MTTISLRAYNREIESMIDNGHFDEAIAHCRHIVQIFPKHIDTYRLLGRAYLETQRFNDADDIFKRILSSIPDDFISHLGMSIIQEKQENLNAAIWHMERAYDVQPANASVQRELRRLFGLRDDFEPVKIQLTRGALARMYLKGDLYPQAIAEVNATLAEDPDRHDLQTILARAFLLSGKKVEAVETCSTLIEKFPFCFEANRILAEVLLETERADEAQTYRERVHALDPYTAHFSTQVTSLEDIPDSSVLLEKLDYTPEEPELLETEQTDWIETFDFDQEGLEVSDDVLPEWLREPLGEELAESQESIEATAETPETVEKEDEDQEPTGDDELIPDWMKSSGWVPASKSEPMSPPPVEELTEELPPAEKTADADMPDWLRDTSLVEPETGEPGVESTPWLEEPPSDDSDTVASWLKDTKSTGDAGQLVEPSLGEEAKIPEWLEDLEIEEGEPATIHQEDSSDEGETEPLVVVSSSDTSEGEISEKAEEPEPGSVDEEVEVPEWLRDETYQPVETGEAEGEVGTVETQDELAAEEPFVIEMPASFEHPEETGETEAQETPIEATAEEKPFEDKTEVEMIDEEQVDTQEVKVPDEEDVQEKPGEVESVEGETTPVEDVPGVTDWLRTLEEVQDEAIPEELRSLEDKDFGGDFEEEKPIEESPKVTDWLKSLEDIDEESVLTTDNQIEDEVFTEEQEEEVETADHIPGVTGWLKTLDEVDEESTIKEPEQPEESVSVESIEETLPTTEDTIVEDKEKVEEPEKRVPGVTDWLKTLKEIEDKSEDEESLVDQTEGIQHHLSDEDMVEGKEFSQEEISKGDVESADFDQAEIPDWLQDLEYELATDDAIDIIPGDIPDWLQAAALEEEKDQEVDWSIFPDEETPLEDSEISGQLDQITEPAPILGDTQPIHRKIEEEEEPVAPLQEMEEETTGEIEEEQPDQVEAVHLTSEEEEDVAMAWLDKLASREGFLEEEQVSEETSIPDSPDWIQEAAAEVDSEIEAEPEVEEVSEWLVEEIEGDVEEPALETIEEAEPMAEEVEEEPAITEAEEPAIEAFEEVEPAAEELEEEPVIIEAEEPAFEAVEPVVEEVEEQPAIIETEEPALEAVEDVELAAEEVEEESVIIEAEEPAFEAVEPVAEEVEEEPVIIETEEPALEAVEDVELAAEELEEEPVITEAEEPTLEAIEEVEPVSEEIEEEPVTNEAEEPTIEAVEEAEPAAEELEEEPVITEAEEEEIILEHEVVDINTASLSQLERIPGVGFTLAQNILNYREMHGPFSSLDELSHVSEVDKSIIDEIHPWLTLDVEKPEPEEFEEKDDELVEAWHAVESGDIPKALEHYRQLISEQKSLDTIISALNEAIRIHPAEILLYETLGDACVREDRLQDALDAYMQAEDLLK